MTYAVSLTKSPAIIHGKTACFSQFMLMPDFVPHSHGTK
jgi:hypothetical protein